MQTIFKYAVPLQDSPIGIFIPSPSKILSFQWQQSTDAFFIWVLVPEDKRAIGLVRTFELIMTGVPIPESPKGTRRSYVGTAQAHGGRFVVHLFERFLD